MSLTTEHRGHEIRYGENSDKWTCSDLNITALTLTKCKAKIDQFYLKLRKQSAVNCLKVSGAHSAPKIEEADIIDYIEKVTQGGGWTNKPVVVVDHTVAIMATSRWKDSDRKVRSSEKISRLCLDTPENRALFAEAERIYREVLIPAEEQFKAALDAIPRVTVENIAELVKIKETEGEITDDG